MRAGVIPVLQRVIVVRFYQLNAGFFLLLFFLLFGVAEPAASLRMHYALMRMMAQQLPVLLVGFAVWTLYGIRCISHCLKQLAEPENAFLYELQALPQRRHRRAFLSCIASIYLPALLYAGCTAVVAAGDHRYGAMAMIILYQSAAVWIGVIICNRRIMHIARESRMSRLTSAIQCLRPGFIPLYQYLAAYALQQKKLLLFLLKAGSLLVLQAMVAINRERLQPEGTYYFLLLIIAAHSLLPYYFVRFTESQVWLRNLPVDVARRYAYFAGTYALLFLPELLFLMLHVQGLLHFTDMLAFYIMAVSMLCGMHAALYLPRMDVERYMLLLAGALPLTMILLAMIPVWWLAASWMLLSVLIFTAFYRRYEAPPE